MTKSSEKPMVPRGDPPAKPPAPPPVHKVAQGMPPVPGHGAAPAPGEGVPAPKPAPIYAAPEEHKIAEGTVVQINWEANQITLRQLGKNTEDTFDVAHPISADIISGASVVAIYDDGSVIRLSPRE